MIAGLALAAAMAATGTPLKAGDGLDCAQGFDALTAGLKASPNAKPYPGRDPLLATYSDGGALALYATTLPGHPAHPAFVKRKINGMGPGVSVATSACGYGDPAAFKQLLKDIEILNAGVRRATADNLLEPL